MVDARVWFYVPHISFSITSKLMEKLRDNLKSQYHLSNKFKRLSYLKMPNGGDVLAIVYNWKECQGPLVQEQVTQQQKSPRYTKTKI